MRCPTCNAPVPADALGLCPACLLEEGLGLIEEADEAFGESFFEDSLAAQEALLESSISTKVLGAVREKTGAISEFLSSERDDSYDVGGLLARGGMGSIHKAVDRNCGRTVAMKLLHASKERDTHAVRRFINEAQITAQLEHPNIIPVHDLGILSSGDRVYYTMKHVQGRDLGSIIDLIKEGDKAMIARFPLTRMLEIFLKVCDAIAFAHARDVVHRDLKPDNIMVGGFGEVLVLDWGLAKVIGDSEIDQPDPMDSLTPSDGRAAKYVAGTAVGQILGTVAYMAPEQAKGANKEIDGRSDIYALGGILYCILTLVPPIRPGSMDEMIDAVRQNQIMDPQQRAREAVYNPYASRGRLPSSLCAVAMKAMAHAPMFRYQRVQELQHDIHAYLSGFATSAEEASPLQELRLYLARKWALFSVFAVAALLLMILGGASIMSMSTQHEALIEARDRATKSANDAITALGLWKESEKKQQSLRSVSALEMLREVEAYIQSEDLAAASVIAKDATDLAPELSAAWFARARLDIAGGDLAQASRHLSHALQLDPDSDLPILVYHAGVVNADLTPGANAVADLAIRLAAHKDFIILHHFLAHPGPQKRAQVIQQLMTTGGRFDINAASDSVGPDGLHLLLRHGSAAPLAGLSLAKVRIETDALSYASLREIDCLELDLRQAPPSDLRQLAGLGLQTLHLPPMNVDAALIDSLGLDELHLYGGQLRRPDAIQSGRLQLHLHGTATGLLSTLSHVKLAGLHLHGLPATAIETAIEQLPRPLTSIGFYDTPLRNLSFLAGRKLRQLILRHTEVTDLTALRGQDLELLDLHGSPVAELAPIAGMRLETLRLSYTKARDLNAIRGMPLRELTVAGLTGLDRAPLAKLHLKILDASHSDLTRLAPLPNMPLQVLRLHGCALGDLNRLGQISSLRDLSIPSRPSPAILQLPNLLRLSQGEQLQPVAAAHLHRSLRRANPEYQDSGKFSFRHGSIVAVELQHANLADIESLRGLPLYSVDLSGNPALEDLSPLDGAPLVSIDLSGTAVTQLSFVPSAPLRQLRMANCAALTTLDLRSSQLLELVIDQSPLRTLRLPRSLKKLSANGVPTAAQPLLLSALALTHLSLADVQLENLDALTSMPLETLRIPNNPIIDTAVLSAFTGLQVLDINGIPAHPEHIPLQALRELWADHGLVQSWVEARADDRIRAIQRLHRDRPSGRFQRFGHEFERLPGAMTLAEARTACDARNGSLLTITNLAEFAFFHQYVLGGEAVWLDFSKQNGNIWEDSQGGREIYLEWEPGAPNGKPERTQIVLGLDGEARMVNRAPDERFGVICQWRK
ncbi:MAG: serine/threonine protein kinase/Leucine-rich repeat (LRR) protein [Rhodothermales bacterium]|jgi:serine/threonine protein kinase/Leucine-rich repeat (LRR) protein